MYDYIVILTFDKNSETRIICLKELLEKNNIKISKKLPPHIAIELYKDVEECTLLKLIEKFIKQIKSLPFRFVSLDQFDVNVNIRMTKKGNEKMPKIGHSFVIL